MRRWFIGWGSGGFSVDEDHEAGGIGDRRTLFMIVIPGAIFAKADFAGKILRPIGDELLASRDDVGGHGFVDVRNRSVHAFDRSGRGHILDHQRFAL